jgi:hypothetical protein
VKNLVKRKLIRLGVKICIKLIRIGEIRVVVEQYLAWEEVPSRFDSIDWEDGMSGEARASARKSPSAFGAGRRTSR